MDRAASGGDCAAVDDDIAKFGKDAVTRTANDSAALGFDSALVDSYIVFAIDIDADIEAGGINIKVVYSAGNIQRATAAYGEVAVGDSDANTVGSFWPFDCVAACQRDCELPAAVDCSSVRRARCDCRTVERQRAAVPLDVVAALARAFGADRTVLVRRSVGRSVRAAIDRLAADRYRPRSVRRKGCGGQERYYQAQGHSYGQEAFPHSLLSSFFSAPGERRLIRIHATVISTAAVKAATPTRT